MYTCNFHRCSSSRAAGEADIIEADSIFTDPVTDIARCARVRGPCGWDQSFDGKGARAENFRPL